VQGGRRVLRYTKRLPEASKLAMGEAKKVNAAPVLKVKGGAAGESVRGCVGCLWVWEKKGGEKSWGRSHKYLKNQLHDLAIARGKSRS